MIPTLALDPASSCGWAWSSGGEINSGVWQLQIAGSEHKGLHLLRLRHRILDAHEQYGIERIVFENASQGSRHEATKVFHNRVSGVILATAAEIGATWNQFVPVSIKAFAGHGHASKEEMVRWLRLHYGIEARNDDEADAIWILKYDEHLRNHPEAAPPSRKLKSKPARGRKVKEPKLF